MSGYKKIFRVQTEAVRQNLIAFLYELPLNTVEFGWKVVITENHPNRTLEQNDKIHAMIRDIQRSGKFQFMGRADWNEEDVKRLLIDAFAEVMREQGTPLKYPSRVVPSLDGKRIVALLHRSREFTNREGSDFIEWLYAYGTELGVKWSL